MFKNYNEGKRYLQIEFPSERELLEYQCDDSGIILVDYIATDDCTIIGIFKKLED